MKRNHIFNYYKLFSQYAHTFIGNIDQICKMFFLPETIIICSLMAFWHSDYLVLKLKY